MSWNTVNWGCLIVLSWFSFFQLVNGIEIDVKAAYIKQQTDIAEPILTDVMKNITRVNIMLQDLIKNYEKLEKMSKAQSVERDSTDTEVEALFDSEIKQRNEGNRKSTTTAQTHKAYATAMFFDEHDPAAESKNESQDAKSGSDSTEGKKEERPKKNEEGMKVENQSETKSNEREVEKAEDSFFPAVKALKNFIKDLSDEPASTGSGDAMAKNDFYISNTSHTFNTPAQPGFFKFNLEEQTLPEEKNHLEPRPENYEMHDIVRRVRENSDDETILIDTPEKKNQSEEKDKNSNEINIIEPEDNKIEPEWSLQETESSEEIKLIQNEELKTNILRQAYGDACLRLVVRKCFMACKSVLKDVCNRRQKCPNKVRSEFKTYAVRGCKEVFHNHNHSIDFRMYSGKNEDEVSEDIQDLTRAGYLSMACFPDKTMTANESVDPNQNNIGVIDPKVKSMNILRDKFEAACQEESARKCYKACAGAAKQTCEGQKCSRRRIKEFGVECKKRCKQNYGGRYRGSKDSDSDSSSDSDTSDRSGGNDNSW